MCSIPYADFVAPALMAASAMNGAVYECTMNVYFKIKHQHLYDAVLATPMMPGDVALGEIGWAVSRGLIYSTAFMLTMWVLGMTGSPWIVLAVPACALIGFAFGAVGMALTTYMRSFADFEYVTTITLPLFLFSATFYPVSSYGSWAWVVQLSPLYHGVALVRGFNLGVFEWSMLVPRRRARGARAGRPHGDVEAHRPHAAHVAQRQRKLAPNARVSGDSLVRGPILTTCCSAPRPPW